MPNWPDFIHQSDLAPGDATPHPALPEGIALHVVASPDAPLFETAYRLLDEEFTHKGELETRAVLAERIAWQPTIPVNGCGMLYNLMVLTVNGEVAAMRDHTAISRPDAPEIVVHLSHVLIVPKWRRMGLAQILRTLPVMTARECAKAIGRPDAPITLFCEMEPIDLSIPANRIRRTSYEEAGFRAVGHQLGYTQPDFRPFALIDADPDGAKPIPFDILYRRVGREWQPTISGDDIAASARMIYAMYAAAFRAGDMVACHHWLDTFTAHHEPVYPLYPPTAVP
jgi:hypothetical protein